jgi:hypothetical protein
MSKLRPTLLITSFLLLLSVSGYSQTHKYYLESGIITASQLGSGKFLLVIDTKNGERKLQFQYRSTENEMHVYDLIKIDEEILSEYQRSISYLKTRTKFSDICIGKGDRLLIKILGESEIISLVKE